MELLEIKQNALHEIAAARDVKELEAARVKYLGRESGELTAVLRSLKNLSVEDKKRIGPTANVARAELEAAIERKLAEFKVKSEAGAGIDITMPGSKVELGHLHPLTLTEQRIREIFTELNFSVVEGPEIETEHYNFDALNIPAGHPARDMWDTFWLRSSQNEATSDERRATSERLLLRTHTSPMQIRYMETHEPPFQIIVPGKVFRFEAIDAGHQINFHQVEGLMVGENVSLANFKYIISEFFKKFFGGAVPMRFRPSYFPFVEPGLEVDIKLPATSDKRQGERWLEVMGAGMVHPKVFDAVKYNPKLVKGFAFGLGLERLAMIKYHIPDIRMFYENDLRFLKQF